MISDIIKDLLKDFYIEVKGFKVSKKAMQLNGKWYEPKYGCDTLELMLLAVKEALNKVLDDIPVEEKKIDIEIPDTLHRNIGYNQHVAIIKEWKDNILK